MSEKHYEMVAQFQETPLITKRTGLYGMPPLASVSSNIRSEVIPTLIRTMEIKIFIQDYDFRDLLYYLRRMPATSLHVLKNSVAGKLLVRVDISDVQRKELNRGSLYSWLRFATSRTGLHMNGDYFLYSDFYFVGRQMRPLWLGNRNRTQELEGLADLMCVRAMRQELNRFLKKYEVYDLFDQV